MSMHSIQGRCFCGDIRFEVRRPESFACFCYCESCQRAAGAPVVAWATYARDTFRTTQGEVHWHRSSPGVTRGICRKCGSSISYENDKQPWLQIGDDLPVYKQTVT